MNRRRFRRALALGIVMLSSSACEDECKEDDIDPTKFWRLGDRCVQTLGKTGSIRIAPAYIQLAPAGAEGAEESSGEPGSQSSESDTVATVAVLGFTERCPGGDAGSDELDGTGDSAGADDKEKNNSQQTAECRSPADTYSVRVRLTGCPDAALDGDCDTGVDPTDYAKLTPLASSNPRTDGLCVSIADSELDCILSAAGSAKFQVRSRSRTTARVDLGIEASSGAKTTKSTLVVSNGIASDAKLEFEVAQATTCNASSSMSSCIPKATGDGPACVAGSGPACGVAVRSIEARVRLTPPPDFRTSATISIGKDSGNPAARAWLSRTSSCDVVPGGETETVLELSETNGASQQFYVCSNLSAATYDLEATVVDPAANDAETDVGIFRGTTKIEAVAQTTNLVTTVVQRLPGAGVDTVDLRVSALSCDGLLVEGEAISASLSEGTFIDSPDFTTVGDSPTSLRIEVPTGAQPTLTLATVAPSSTCQFTVGG